MQQVKNGLQNTHMYFLQSFCLESYPLPFQTVSTSYLRRVLVPEIKMLTILFPACSISSFSYFKTFLEYLRVQNT